MKFCLLSMRRNLWTLFFLLFFQLWRNIVTRHREGDDGSTKDDSIVSNVTNQDGRNWNSSRKFFLKFRNVINSPARINKGRKEFRFNRLHRISIFIPLVRSCVHRVVEARNTRFECWRRKTGNFYGFYDAPTLHGRLWPWKSPIPWIYAWKCDNHEFNSACGLL